MAYKIVHSKIIFVMVLLLCVFTFPRLLSWATAKTFKAGKEPPGHFLVAVSNESKERPFRLIPFTKISVESDFYVNREKSLTIRTGEFSYEIFHLLDWADGNPVIETVSGDDDYTFTNKYQIKNRHLVPLRKVCKTPSSFPMAHWPNMMDDAGHESDHAWL